MGNSISSLMLVFYAFSYIFALGHPLLFIYLLDKAGIIDWDLKLVSFV